MKQIQYRTPFQIIVVGNILFPENAFLPHCCALRDIRFRLSLRESLPTANHRRTVQGSDTKVGKIVFIFASILFYKLISVSDIYSRK